MGNEFPKAIPALPELLSKIPVLFEVLQHFPHAEAQDYEYNNHVIWGQADLGKRLILVLKTDLTPHGKDNAKGSTNVFFAVSRNGSAVVFNNFFGNG